jgi:hypothetical protein
MASEEEFEECAKNPKAELVLAGRPSLVVGMPVVEAEESERKSTFNNNSQIFYPKSKARIPSTYGVDYQKKYSTKEKSKYVEARGMQNQGNTSIYHIKLEQT